MNTDSIPLTPTMVSTGYPATQDIMSTSAKNSPDSDQIQQQKESSFSSMLRLSGGGCIKGCLEAICCCCALDAICWCELDEICC
ncbi:hypothetical protein PHYBLDRAFT_158813 [Phycomyces blakesleeanus NRRL 1555(-)]|uniref:Uncharacterized protein n=1 Tax=Phycomyces blakesleeanus (strain ATCC 8743b / DSM 1359 / FGSC 10004 / NBRC 33097 / NRRL 1555) TaxID=763407 RepID=A0A162PTQ9_PHYB8|nr:hypothetical protein PHYBLDRAFT_158813 [Phycomyces blakesleeanus NRRL 1555(-)]OAD73856.1 hypothetical protein PHYBLDRAFT_158813 [Phycomyces blakesleeanus NRRL 1555(-)]|eukprot:XP_018291896.1 hypothetical protein PHYBLDRAFT_158813 [Phycomyces blakesleeanus NRRL 1555(-)]